MLVDSVTQPFGRSNLTVLSENILAANYDHVDVAAAYVTTGGARDVLKMLEHSLGARWATAQKRWLVSFDYCRSEPLAIKMLSSAPASHVRIHEGAKLILQRCTPKTPFHPKAFLLRGGGGHLVFAGSGNLSRSGLNTGNEVGLLMGITAAAVHPAIAAQVNLVQRWYENIWRRADRLTATLLDSYADIFDSIPNRKNPVPTEDDLAPSARRANSALSPEQLRKLRVCTKLWIEAGNVTRNLGQTSPGNQLMMKRLSRVLLRRTGGRRYAQQSTH